MIRSYTNKWTCPHCNYYNYINPEKCSRCKKYKNDEVIPKKSLEVLPKINHMAYTIKDNKKCIICMSNNADSGFLHDDSVHSGFCFYCALQTKQNNICPLCRKSIEKIVKIY